MKDISTYNRPMPSI